METFVKVTKSEKNEIYEEIIPQIASLLEGEEDLTANLANTAAVLKMAFPSTVSWVGFYILKDGELVLGPFQGKPACVRIKIGKGVCGTAAARRETTVVPNVEEFPEHIYCDRDSRSEIVVPLLHSGKVAGVLDLDSPLLGTFDETDKVQLEKIASRVSHCFHKPMKNI
jgi:GAF domain-containing protein